MRYAYLPTGGEQPPPRLEPTSYLTESATIAMVYSVLCRSGRPEADGWGTGLWAVVVVVVVVVYPFKAPIYYPFSLNKQPGVSNISLSANRKEEATYLTPSEVFFSYTYLYVT